jgi:hypothetical protein
VSLPADDESVTSASSSSAVDELISPPTATAASSSSPPLMPSQSPPATAAVVASPSASDFDLEVGAVNAAAATAAAAEAATVSVAAAASGSATNSRVPTPVQAQVALQAQFAAQSMSSQLFGTPGEEQLADDYFDNGAQAQTAARARRASAQHLLLGEVAPGLVTPAPPPTGSVCVAPPSAHHQWHLLSVAELLGHQVPVTALSLHRDHCSFYSGDANGNVLHFTVAGSDSGFACACKQSRNRARVKLFQSLALGASSSASSASPRLTRIVCKHDRCAHLCCDFCYMDHVRQAHPHPTAERDNATAVTTAR